MTEKPTPLGDEQDARYAAVARAMPTSELVYEIADPEGLSRRRRVFCDELDARVPLRAAAPIPTPERIVAAAISVNGVVWTLPPPARHHILVHAWAQAHWRDGKATPVPDDHIQGFVTNTGRFLDRDASLEIARAAGQLRGDLIGGVLTSEDLW